MAGALDGVTVIELAGIGPAPFAGMMLADHGARVIRVERPDNARFGDFGDKDVVNRNREIVTLDLKQPGAIEQVLALVEQADAFIEGNRPGVIERLGLGPDVLLARNPRLVIGRMTGWGQDGPKAHRAGHDINYVALSGALSTFGPREQPMAPMNVVGDYGGGGMLLAFGLLAGIISARSTGRGQVIDCAMVDGASVLSAMTYTMFGNGMLAEQREANVIDGGAHYYRTYETADGGWVSIGSLEPQFYAMLLEKLGLTDDPAFAYGVDRGDWPELRARLAAIFKTKTRDEWCALMEDTDICFAPVLSVAEAPQHPHNVARGTFVEAGGIVQPAPAPRFLGTPAPPVRMSKR
ncbi:CoA transferase [Novosphingobium sp. G106]|uniref:CaiB/BaiF CoA transferase family protein n=1 Tax=Novosphingobium sp. G106 TaxID=2849500 RepID=UPI001C2D1EDD|nr:CaiB/BaiF CoA-transferase family protein [Novosphingobium sp. G106]MBV1687477.1 CoA transferase [Novosphingobium sp. G106]